MDVLLSLAPSPTSHSSGPAMGEPLLVLDLPASTEAPVPPLPIQPAATTMVNAWPLCTTAGLQGCHQVLEPPGLGGASC